MKLEIFFFVCLFAGCFAQRERKQQRVMSMSGPSSMMSHPMMSEMMNPFERPRSDFEQLCSSCLPKVSEMVDIVIDVKSYRVTVSEEEPFGFWWPFSGFRPMPMTCYDLPDFVEILSKYIPKQFLYVVLVDGEAGNQTRYYLNEPVPTVSAPTPTTPAPVTGYTHDYNNGVSMMRWWYHQTYQAPAEPPRPTLRQMVSNALYSRAMNKPIDYPKSRDPVSTTFSVVITDSSQKTLLSSVSGPSDRTVILDIGGKMAATKRNYLERNVLIVPDYSSLNKFAQTVQFMICQAAGGNTGVNSAPRQEVAAKAEFELPPVL